jgi:hypothetical protein
MCQFLGFWLEQVKSGKPINIAAKQWRKGKRWGQVCQEGNGHCEKQDSARLLAPKPTLLPHGLCAVPGMRKEVEIL